MTVSLIEAQSCHRNEGRFGASVTMRDRMRDGGRTAKVGFESLSIVRAGGMHPAPERQLMVVLSGRDEIIASNGTSQTFEPGDTLLMKDTAGKGHISRCTDDTAVLMVHLA